MFDYLAIDWGEKRCGLAFGSSLTGLVLSADYIAENSSIMNIITSEIEKRQIKIIILGLPTNFQGGLTNTSKKILDFKSMLMKEFPKTKIITSAERGSTKAGVRQMREAKTGKDKDLLNHLAAKKILEDYFTYELR